jgi:hypothetical protein
MKTFTPIHYYEYKIAKHFVSALINGDESGLTDEESKQLSDWEQSLPNHYYIKAPQHKVFAVAEDDDTDFAECEVCGLFADCTTLTVNYI